MKKLNLLFVLLIIPLLIYSQEDNNAEFELLNNSDKWVLEFSDSGTENWKSNWHLDGLIAKVENTPDGMHVQAGPEFGNDIHHMVLWTKESFKGDVKIEFDYTRTDNQTLAVNILYIQATGKGEGEYVEDIFEWNELRKIPSMRTYYNNMKTLHISFAAFPNNDDVQDYIRVRRYPVTPEKGFRKLEVEPTFFETGLFKTGETYHITAVKTNERLFFKVDVKNASKIYSWDISHLPPLKKGRVGLRHMYTRSAIYKDFRIYTK
jgi:hypothetical protein